MRPRRPERAEALPAARPPALDPQRIYGYDVTFTYTAVEVSPTFKGRPPYAVGESERSVWRCKAGACRSLTGLVSFRAATPSYSFTRSDSLFPGRSSACEPITNTARITRAPDGSYTGASSSTPKHVHFQGRYGGLFHVCNAVRTAGTLRLVPIVMLAAGTEPDLSVPAALDPVRITGYTGTTTPSGGAKDAVKATTIRCEGGVCTLTCQPLCGVSSIVSAAAPMWSLTGLQPSPLCGTGRTTLSLTRAADGSYAGTALTAYATRVSKPAISCPTTLSISLKPQTR